MGKNLLRHLSTVFILKFEIRSMNQIYFEVNTMKLISSGDTGAHQPNWFLLWYKLRSWFYWHCPCESRAHTGSENAYNTHNEKVCLNYLFCSMWWHILKSKHLTKQVCLIFSSSFSGFHWPRWHQKIFEVSVLSFFALLP